MRLTIHGPNLRSSATTFVVHTEHCRDNARVVKRYGGDGGWTIDVASQTELCDSVYPPGDFNCESGEYLYEFCFAPCVKGLPTK